MKAEQEKANLGLQKKDLERIDLLKSGKNDKNEKFGLNKELNGFKSLKKRFKDEHLIDPETGDITKRINYRDGSYYEGDMVRGARHGKGKQVWADGSHYDGNWLNDRINGFGTLVDKDGNKMTGSWRDNKLNGFAIKEKVNGDKYEGQWINDMKSGQGSQSWVNGAKYSGDFVNNYLCGEGKFTWPDGSTYEGKQPILLVFQPLSFSPTFLHQFD